QTATRPENQNATARRHPLGQQQRGHSMQAGEAGDLPLRPRGIGPCMGRAERWNLVFGLAGETIFCAHATSRGGGIDFSRIANNSRKSKEKSQLACKPGFVWPLPLARQ